MANNCLVTKLKAVVDNDSLVKVGEILLTAENAQETIGIIFNPAISDKSSVIELSPNVTFSNMTSDWPVVTGTGTIKIKSKYTLSQLNLMDAKIKVNISDLKYCGALTIFSITPLMWKTLSCSQLKDLPSSLTTLTFSNGLDSSVSNVEGSVEDIAHLSNLTTLAATGMRHFTGTMERIATLFPSLTNLGTITNTGFTGSIESFVAVRRNQGVTEGSVRTSYGQYSNITFNGERLTGGDNTPFSWTATTITYNGVTINA